MKRLNNIYDEIIDIKKIEDMYKKRIKKNTKNKKKLERFEDYYVENIINIKNILISKNYQFDKYSIFLIRESKLRLIMSQSIRDKLINHLVSEYFLVKIFDKTLIEENIATRKNKGTHYGLKLIKQYLNEIKDKNFYVLKFDVTKYFFNLDHSILKELIRKKIKDKDVLNVLDNIIDSTDSLYVNKQIKKIKEKEITKILNSNHKDKLINDINLLPFYKKGKGLSIGNMSSQILAILYLNELDHYIKEKLNIKYYIRYMDDGILIHESKEYLKYCLSEIEKIIDKYKLTLNNKTCILNIKQGFEFLGFRFYIKNNKVLMKVKNETKKRFKKKLNIMNNLLEKNKIKFEDLRQVRNSYLGHLSHGSTNNLVYKELKKYKKYKVIKYRKNRYIKYKYRKINVNNQTIYVNKKIYSKKCLKLCKNNV